MSAVRNHIFEVCAISDTRGCGNRAALGSTVDGDRSDQAMAVSGGDLD
jgi:hypothetical protein